MVIMRDQSRDQICAIDGNDGRACDLHGRAWTGTTAAIHDDEDVVAVLQYVHPDFVKVTEAHIVDFAEERVCKQCGDATEPMPLWLADRILKAYPGLVLMDGYYWEGLCRQCSPVDGCPHCEKQSGDDDDDDANDQYPTHPYLH